MKEQQDIALAELEALVKIPGSLKIITAEVHPDYRLDRKDPRSTAKEGVDLRRPASYVLHDVVEISKTDHLGRVTARSAEGDYTYGYPHVLVRRLRQWMTEA